MAEASLTSWHTWSGFAESWLHRCQPIFAAQVLYCTSQFIPSTTCSNLLSVRTLGETGPARRQHSMKTRAMLDQLYIQPNLAVLVRTQILPICSPLRMYLHPVDYYIGHDHLPKPRRCLLQKKFGGGALRSPEVYTLVPYVSWWFWRSSITQAWQ